MNRLSTRPLCFIALLSTLYIQTTQAQNFEWAQFLTTTDGSHGRYITDMTTDDAGNVYVLGEYDRNSVIGQDTIKVHAYDRYSCYISKFSPEGELQWIHGFGSTWFDYSHDIAFANGSIYAAVFLQADTVKFNNYEFVRDPAENTFIINFDTDGNYIKHAGQYFNRQTDVLTAVDTLLYVGSRNEIIKLDYDLNKVGSLTFGSRQFVDIKQIINVNDTSILVGGFFGMNISLDSTEINDTLSGSGQSAFLASINTKNSLNWMQILGRLQPDLQLAYSPGSSDFYLSGNYKDAFQLGSDFMAPNLVGKVHSFVAKASINDGIISSTGRIDPRSSSALLLTNLLFTNGQSVFVGGYTYYGTIGYSNADDLRFGNGSFGQIFKLSTNLDYDYGVAFGPKLINSGRVTAGVLVDNRLYIGGHISGNEGQIGCDTYDKRGQVVFLMEDAAPDEAPSVRFTLSSATGGEVKIRRTLLSDYDYHYWDFDDGTPFDSVTLRPVHVYERKGVINLTLHAGNKCGESSYTRTLRIRGMGYLSPNNTGNTNLYVGKIKGVGLKEGATFRLITAQGVEKEIREANYIDSTSYNIIVELENDPQLTYDLYMQNGEEADTLRNALKVNSVDPVNILCKFTGPPLVLSSRFFNYNLQVENLSNVTAYGVPVSIVGAPQDVIRMGRTTLVRNDISQKWITEMGGHWRYMTNKATGRAYQLATFIIPVLPPGEKFFFSFQVETSNSGPSQLTAYYNQPIFGVSSFFLDDLGSIPSDSLVCPDSPVLEHIVNLFGVPFGEEAGFTIANLGCILYSYLIDIYGGGVMGTGGFGGGNSPGTFLGNAPGVSFSGGAVNIGPLILESLAKVYPEKSNEEIVKELDNLTDLIPETVQPADPEEIDMLDPSYEECLVKGCLLPFELPLEPIPDEVGIPILEPLYHNCETMDCPDLLSLPDPSFWRMIFEAYWDFVTVNALDPNEKYPVQGQDENNYIAKGRELDYHITFENADTATAPASEVFVYDTLDLSVLDTTRFSWNSIGFGDINIALNVQGTHVVEDIDLRPYGGNAIVRFEGKVDTTGVLSAVYTTLDSATMVLTENVLDGFLPPNQSKPEGEGFFNFSIGQQPNLPHGTRIENRASIIFDRNEPIATGLAVNTIDDKAPESFVVPFDQPEQYDSLLHVEFSGFDGESGVRGYNVYVSVNDNGYNLFAKEYKLNYMDIAASYGNTYSFIVGAVDNVSNREDKPFQEEARISIVNKVTGLKDEIDANRFMLFPNPANNEVSIIAQNNYTLLSYQLHDLSGRIIRHQKLNGTPEDIVRLEGLNSGIYLINMETNAGTIKKKIVKR